MNSITLNYCSLVIGKTMCRHDITTCCCPWLKSYIHGANLMSKSEEDIVSGTSFK